MTEQNHGDESEVDEKDEEHDTGRDSVHELVEGRA
jgi:hypothetical protein